MNDYSNTYCEAKFWRPTGLGNRLFAWSRAKVFSQQTGCRMLSPEWAHIRGASIVRGGIKYRNALRKILLFDNFHPDENEISGVRKIILRKQCTITEVITLDESLHLLPGTGEKTLISFAGHTGHVFDELWLHREAILLSLKNITNKKWLSHEKIYDSPFIGINVRLGNDFKKPAGINDFLHNKVDYLQTPLAWYVATVRKIRELVGENYRAVVVSDGSENDLRLLLQESNVIYSKSKSAIGDLLLLANATILIGAGRSSFSAWASFLGKTPTITIPGSSLQEYHVSNDSIQHFVGEFDPASPSEAFCRAINNLEN